MTEILSFLRNLYICELYAGVPFHFTPACVLVHFQCTVGQIIYRDPFVFSCPSAMRRLKVSATILLPVSQIRQPSSPAFVMSPHYQTLQKRIILWMHDCKEDAAGQLTMRMPAASDKGSQPYRKAFRFFEMAGKNDTHTRNLAGR